MQALQVQAGAARMRVRRSRGRHKSTPTDEVLSELEAKLDHIEDRIRELRASGRGIISIARELRVAGGTVQRVLKSQQAVSDHVLQRAWHHRVPPATA